MGFDVVIRNGQVIDGTGAPERQADVAVADGKIAAFGAIEPSAEAGLEIEATGMVVAPGFIDIHTHADQIRQIAPDFFNCRKR